jgi:hypothetical protein
MIVRTSQCFSLLESGRRDTHANEIAAGRVRFVSPDRRTQTGILETLSSVVQAFGVHASNLEKRRSIVEPTTIAAGMAYCQAPD